MPRVLVCLALAAAFAVAGAAVAANPGAKQLPGTWTTKLEGKKPVSLNGDWAMQITRSGNYTIVKRVKNTAKLMVKGEIYLFGTRGATFKNEKGPAACTGSQAAGRYTFSVVGKTLKFTRIRDTCMGRRTVLGEPFKKVA